MGIPERERLELEAETIRWAIERADANENPIERLAQLDQLYQALGYIEEDLSSLTEQGQDE